MTDRRTTHRPKAADEARARVDLAIAVALSRPAGRQLSVEELAREVGRSRTSIVRHVARLVGEGVLVATYRSPYSRGTNLRTFRLASPGEAAGMVLDAREKPRGATRRYFVLDG